MMSLFEVVIRALFSRFPRACCRRASICDVHYFCTYASVDR